MVIVEMSLSGSIMIGLILIFRAIGRNRISRGTLVALWDLVVIRLLVPFSIPMEGIMIVEKIQSRDSGQGGFSLSQEAWNSLKTFQENSLEMLGQERIRIHPAEILTWIWGIGAICFLLYFLRLYQKERAALKNCISIQNSMAERMIHAYGFRRRIRLYGGKAFKTPVTYGIFFSNVVLPIGEEKISRSDMRNMIAHELEHIRTFDVGKRYLMILAVCLHWFNPLVWFMYRFYQEDQEMACDERVLRSMGKRESESYIYTMIKMATEEKRFYATTTGFGGKNSGRKRILAALHQKHRGIAGAAAAAAMTICLFPGFVSFSQEGKRFPAQRQDDTQKTIDLAESETGETEDIPELVEPRFDGTSYMVPYDEEFDYNGVMQDMIENYNDFSQEPTEDQVKAVQIDTFASLAKLYKEQKEEGLELSARKIWMIEEYGMVDISE